MKAFVQIGKQRIPLRVKRYGTIDPATPDGSGKPNELSAVFYEGRRRGHAFGFATVAVCHEGSCAVVKRGKARGPCSCGGDDLWREICRRAGVDPDGDLETEEAP